MAWIRSRRRKDGTTIQQVNWRDRVSNKQYAETFADQITAKAFLRDVEAAGEAWPPDWVPGLGYPQPDENPSGYTVRTACIKAVEVNQRANSGTKADYLHEIDRYLPDTDPLARMFVEKVDAEAIEEWHARLAKMTTKPGGPANAKRRKGFDATPLSLKTRRNAHTRLSSGLAAMVRYGHIPRNSAFGLGPTGSGHKKVQALSPTEYNALLTYIPVGYAAFVDTLARTGMRFSEATALTARRVDLKVKPAIIHVEDAWKRTGTSQKYVIGSPKNGAGARIVTIDDSLAAKLAVIIADRDANDRVFQTPQGAVIRHNNFHPRIWRPAVLAASESGAIPFVPGIHDLRHAHASWLLDQGMQVNSVADRLGHDPAVLLRTYSHLMDKARNQGAAIMEQLLDGTEMRNDGPDELQVVKRR